MRLSPSRLVGACSAAVLAVVLLGGCGTGSDEPSAAAASDGVFPVTVEHAFGSTTVESEPTRVVSVGYTEQDTLLALGVVPSA